MNQRQDTGALYGQYVAKMQKIADLRYAGAVLEWDQETYLPTRGAEIRARQLATLASQAHEMFTAPAMGALLEELDGHQELGGPERANVARSLEDYRSQSKYPAAFVEELSMATSESYHAWMEARKKNDFRVFSPALSVMVALKRRQAELLGYREHPYDALVDEYEKGMTVAQLDVLFGEVRASLKGLLDEILAKPSPDDNMLHGHYDRDRQWELGISLLKAMGFDFQAGRQDISEHPFTTNFNARDVRLTTRIAEGNLSDMTWSCIHEGGHGLYEQGLPFDQYGLPLGEAASLAIHESQSRLWENNVGRGRAFWMRHYPGLQDRFPRLKDTGIEAFYHAINKVSPSLIRTEADEVTYHFHVMIRYELEKKLLTGDLEVSGLADAWNELYHTYLGVTVPDDKSGVLQDVHWSHGSFGYFPTYSLGSFYAAQFYAAATREIPDLAGRIAGGDLASLLEWLREHIHRYGRAYYPGALCERVTGEPLNFRYFMDYVRDKYGAIYGF